uniref:Aquaporin-3 n=1 Tax=Anas zonorhyncha TaxID=75864 RepID=A0A8B9VH65_9AVES
IVLSRGTHGGFLTVNLAFGFAVMLGILISGRGHLNPAVTFAMCFLAWEPWIKLPIYALAQTLGAFLGAGIVFGFYYVAIWAFGNNQLYVTGQNATAGIFATYPSHCGRLDAGSGRCLQLLLAAWTVVHSSPVIGFVVLLIGTSMGFNSGYAVNPARDFGPCLFTAIDGWGSEVLVSACQ